MNPEGLTIRIRRAGPALSLGLHVIFSRRVDWVVASDGPELRIPPSSGLLVVAYNTGMALTRWPATCVPMLIVPYRDREWDVLQLVATGDCNKLIASQPGIEVETVKSHVKGLGKLGAWTRTHALAIAAERGLVLHGASASIGDSSRNLE